MAVSVDVVLPVRNGWEMTKTCLEHLRGQTAPHRVILVDNSSTDGTSAHTRSGFPEVRVLENGENLGFGPACNRGAAVGTGDVVILLSNDAFCRPDFVEHVAAAFEQNPRAGSVATVTVQPDEDALDGVGITIDRTLASFVRLQGKPLAAAGTFSPRLAGPGGGADAYRREAFEQVGGFDERLLFYFTDTDLDIRLHQAGWEVALAVDAVSVHLRSATTGHRSRRSRSSGGWGRGYLLRRYGVLRRALLRTLATEAIVVCGDAVLCRDLEAFRSRVAGWRAARGLPVLEWPDGLIDHSLSFADSLRLRWSVR